MVRSKEAIEKGLELYRTLLGNHPEVEEEFAATRGWFARVTADSDDPERRKAEELVARRHLEWFLLEHPSELLGGVPATVLLEDWLNAEDGIEEAAAQALVNSQAGAFQVTAVDRAQGIWLRDLFGVGEYPVEEPEAAAEIEVGDLIVGRIFPLADGAFLLSPAASCFRNPDLVQAVHEDAERMRAGRRGVLRIEQLELERLFFGAVPAPTQEGRDALARAGQVLRTAGLPAEQTKALLDAVREAAAAGNPAGLTKVLNQAAFESAVDLEELRTELMDYWNRTATAVSTPAADAPRVGMDPAAALAAFDAGRASGRELDELFADLERDLGCADAKSIPAVGEEDIPDLGDAVIQDFPWAVGAMVEEYFWERGRDPARGLPAGHEILRLLSEYGERIGVFENLGPRDLLDFTGRWVLDHARLRDADEARQLLGVLADFAGWCDAEHALALRDGFAAMLPGLEEALPRLTVLRQGRTPADREDCLLYDVANMGEEEVVLTGTDGADHRVRLEASLVAHLRTGDVLLARLEDERTRVTGVYPGILTRWRDAGGEISAP